MMWIKLPVRRHYSGYKDFLCTYYSFQKVLAMGMSMVTSATTGPAEDTNDVRLSSPTIHSLTKRSPVDLGLFKKKIVPNPLKILDLKLGPLKKLPLVLKKKVSLPIQKVIKTVPLALKKGLLPIALPLALKNPLLAKKTFIKGPPQKASPH